MRCTRFIAAAAAVLLLAGCDPDARRLHRGSTAYKKGDYPAALEAWTPLAQAGHAEAQFDLGEMYYTGRGQDQDYLQAREWFLKAAEQGNGMACLRLGMMYAAAQGVDLDFVEAYEWTLRALSKKVFQAERLRVELAKRLSAEEIAEAENETEDWNPPAGN
jgi:uncharacterized protein